jgi:DNA-binding winged helix-turn-helix (wHTH) protein
MTEIHTAQRYRFGTFEADATTGELRRQGLRVRLAAQPFQVLILLLEHPGELLSREEICRALWPEGTFVDYEHGVNSAVNRIREALGDAAGNPRFIETLARRGYRFIAPVERIASGAAVVGPDTGSAENGIGSSILATEEDLPRTSPRVVRTLFILLQFMYLGFYVGALGNLREIGELLSPLPRQAHAFTVVIVTAAILIPLRVFLVTGVLFHAPGLRGKFLKIWPFILIVDVLWSLSPFLLLHHIAFGLALACTALLVYSPFAQRSLVLMGAAGGDSANAAETTPSGVN